MSVKDFVKKYIYPTIIEDYISCDDPNTDCNKFITPNSVIVNGNNVLIIGDNRIKDGNSTIYYAPSSEYIEHTANKIILITDINLTTNNFKIKYIEPKTDYGFYLYLFTRINKNDPKLYSFGAQLAITNDNILINKYYQNMSYPIPIITFDQNYIYLKQNNNILFNYAIDENIVDIPSNKTYYLNKDDVLQRKKDYILYFSGKIKSYQAYLIEEKKKRLEEEKKRLKELEEQKKKDQAATILRIKIIIGVIVFIIFIIFIIIIIIKYKNKLKANKIKVNKIKVNKIKVSQKNIKTK